MRKIPHVNNPPFRPGMATVGFLKICGSLEKMYMNPHLEYSQKNKRHTPWPCRLRRGPYLYMYKTSTFFAHLLLLVMLLRRNDGYSCLSQFSFCFSFCQSKAPYALRIHIQTWFDCKTNLKTGTNLAILKQCTRHGLSRKSLHRESCHANAALFRPGLSHPGMKSSM